MNKQHQPVFERELHNVIPGTIIEEFKDPKLSRPMVRYWFPDASAAATEQGLEVVRQELRDMYKAGYSGVEIAMVPRFAIFDSKKYGWGSPLFQRLIKEILRECSTFSDPPFKVDLTSTPQWPVSVDIIDPNDDAASMEIAHQMQKVTSLTGAMNLDLPAKRRLDFAGAPFIFQDRFMAATVAKVTAVGENGALMLDPATMKDITGLVSERDDLTAPAGIPDMNDPFCQQEYANIRMKLDGNRPDLTMQENFQDLPVTNENIMRVFGEAPPVGAAEKVGAQGRRKRLADTQRYYRINDLSSLGIPDAVDSKSGIHPGDWVVFGFYQRGTGHSLGSDVKMFYPVNNGEPGVPYVIDHFSTYGSRATQSFWDQKIFDAELLELLEQNRGGLFEDSIETLSASPFWSKNLLRRFIELRGYDITPYLPLILTAGHGKSDKITPYDTGRYTADDGCHITFIEDYYATLTDMYIKDYISDMQRWANEKFRGTYRSQAYNTTGMKSRMNLDTPRTALVVGISEGESLNFATNYDRFRGISGGVNISGKQLVSDEVLALMPRAYDMPFSESIATINRDFSVGVNHMVVHGVSTARASDEFDGGLWSQWPGWHAFGAYVADSWSARQPYYEDLHTMNGYMARLQAVMQNGQVKMDLLLFAPNAFVGDGDTSDNRDRSLLREALDKGYTYDMVSEDALLHHNSVVRDGVLIPSGPGYKALVVYDAPGVSLAAANKMKEYAEAGLPIIFIGAMPHRVLGVSGDAYGISTRQTDAEIAEAMDKLADNDHVYVIDSIADLNGMLAQINLTPAASYDFRYMRNLRRVDSEGTSYYYLYNNAEEDADVQVALEGDGIPYKLNCWNGDITPITEYGRIPSGLVVRVQLESTESVIIALTPDTARFGPAPALSVTELDNGEAVFKDGHLYHRVPQSGLYSVTLSDGTPLSIETTVPEAISMNEGWTFELESWGPFGDYSDKPTTLSEKIAVVFENFTLMSWKEIHAADEQIRTLKLDNLAPGKLAALDGNPMGAVVGVGRYKKSFILPKLGNCEGYYLKCSHGHDQVTRIIVNGRSIGALDQSKTIFDIGRLLAEGNNTIEIMLSTTLNNRLKIEYVTPDYWKEQMRQGTHYETDHPRYGGFLFEKSTVRPYGLTAVSLIPYYDSELK